MKIEIGKTYPTRCGGVVKVVEEDGGWLKCEAVSNFPGYCWPIFLVDNNGQFTPGTEHDLDIVGEPKSMESWMLRNGKGHFYTDKEDRQITALASYYKRKVKTERLITVSPGKEPGAKYITKVTLL